MIQVGLIFIEQQVTEWKVLKNQGFYTPFLPLQK